VGRTRLKNDRDYVAIGRKYAEDVVSGVIPACRWVRAACQRHLDDLTSSGKWTFDRERASKICRFAEMLPHVKGRWKTATFVLEPWQCFVLTVIFGWVDAEGMRRFRKALIVLPRKNGKALDVNTPIPTPDGWTTMRQVQPGDVVLDDKGNPTTVMAVSEVFSDHDCYELTFSNGERIVADAGHRWLTSARVDRIGGNQDAEFRRARGILAGVVRHGTGADVTIARAVNGESAITRVRTTDEIFKTQKYGKRNDRNHSISVSAALQLPEVILPVDPYILGAWLGDGTSASASITCGSQDKDAMMRLIQETGYGAVAHPRGDSWNISIRATEIDLFGDRVHVSRSSKENLAARLRRLNVLNNKHIPAQYLRASVDQRLSLLQGLMDTDGTIDKKGRVLSYTSVNEQLAVGVAELLSTLGIKYGIRQNVMTCNGRLVPGTAYDIQFMAFRDELPVFRLTRKLDRMRRRAECSVSPRSKTIQISEVRQVEPRPVKCIQVESESSMFLCGRTMIPTHNSALASIVALYGLALDKEPGAEVYAAATTRDQAKVVWDVSRRMAQRTPRFCEVYGVSPLAHSITVEQTGSCFKPLSRDADSLEGLNPHFAIVDELHAHSVREVFDVLDEATGARRQPLIFIISTEGDNPAGVFAEQVTYAQHILEGRHIDDSYFAAMYTIDPEDDWRSPASWIKANPNLGVSVFEQDIEIRCRQAERNPASQASFLTKRLNVRVGSSDAYFNMLAWRTICRDDALNIEQFDREDCMIGLDLASKNDVAALVHLFRRNGRYFVFGRYYLPEDCIEKGKPNYDIYRGWAETGLLTLTPGNATDFEFIERDLMRDRDTFNVIEVAFDPSQAMELSTRMQAQGLTMTRIPQMVSYFNEPMKDLAARIISGKIVHDGNPILDWMMGNVGAKQDAQERVFPCKSHPDSKIDGAVAAIMAIGRFNVVEDSTMIYTGLRAV